MKIAVVDDIQLYRDRAKKCIMQYYRNADNITIDFYESGESYLESKSVYDISFIDIEMNGIDGFETIKRARRRYREGVYIILTTHTEMCDRGYLVNAYRYINKEKMEELIEEALKSADIFLEKNRKIKINVVGEGEREIALKDISYIESFRHNIIVHMKQGIKRCNDNMKDLEDELCDKWFFRCHKAFIVNLDEIEKVEDLIVYMKDGSDLDIAQRKLWEFRRVYLKRIYDCGNV